MKSRKTAEDRKREIIDATLVLADEQGPDRLSIESIARKIGLSQPGIFRHFPKKQDIWEAVANHLIKLMQRRWHKVLSSSETPLTQLHHLVIGQLKLINTTPAIPAILLSRELHTKERILRDTFSSLMMAFHGHISSLINDADELRKDINTNDAAFLIIGMIQGLALRWTISGKAFDIVKEGERLLDLQLDVFANKT